jgi:hypothetical protein
MFYQPILKLGLHSQQCGKGSFIFNNTNDLDNYYLNKLHELTKMSIQHQIICDKLPPQFTNWILISRLFHDFKSLNFHGQLEKKCL